MHGTREPPGRGLAMRKLCGSYAETMRKPQDATFPAHPYHKPINETAKTLNDGCRCKAGCVKVSITHTYTYIHRYIYIYMYDLALIDAPM